MKKEKPSKSRRSLYAEDSLWEKLEAHAERIGSNLNKLLMPAIQSFANTIVDVPDEEK